MSGARLAQRLNALGIPARVEAVGKMAVVTVADGAMLADVAVRDAAIAAASELGFGTLALELADDDTGRAPLSGR